MRCTIRATPFEPSRSLLLHPRSHFVLTFFFLSSLPPISITDTVLVARYYGEDVWKQSFKLSRISLEHIERRQLRILRASLGKIRAGRCRGRYRGGISTEANEENGMRAQDVLIRYMNGGGEINMSSRPSDAEKIRIRGIGCDILIVGAVLHSSCEQSVTGTPFSPRCIESVSKAQTSSYVQGFTFPV